jgi:hypothetical protein
VDDSNGTSARTDGTAPEEPKRRFRFPTAFTAVVVATFGSS